MFEILRNMGRRKVRTGLTVFGIVIGIFTLTVMGSMTEYFNTLIDNAVKLVGSNIYVTPKSGDFQSVLTPNDLRRIERVPGVQAAIPLLSDTLEEFSSVNISVPEIVISAPPEHAHQVWPAVTLQRGRWLQRGDSYAAVIGSKIASKRNLDLGGVIRYRDHDFTVVGLINETQTAPDSEVMIPLETARRLLKSPDLIIAIYVVPRDAAQANALAQVIKGVMDDANVQTPEELINQTRQGLLLFNVILLSGAVIAVLVGSLAVINTMIMSVHERRHEIGLKKAIGASDGEIVFEYIVEAALIGLLGGVFGFLVGWGMATLLNAVLGSSLGGSEIFTVTPRLFLVVFPFAIILGAGAGVIPAWNAARVDPVVALRNE